MTSERRLEEPRPAPDWAGDVELGVQAWVGTDRPTPARARWQPPPVDPAVEVPEADHEAIARKILLDALTGQARSRKELADKLAKCNVPDDLAAQLLDRFTEVGLIDDAAFASAWVESRQRSRGLAPRALSQELRRKGIADDLAKEALEQVSEDDQREAATALVRRKLRSVRGLDRQKATRRLVAMLARKGYGAGLAFAVVRDELAADDAAHTDDADTDDALDTGF